MNFGQRGQARKVFSASGSATLVAAVSGARLHLNLANVQFASAYAAGDLAIMETDASGTQGATLGGFMASEGCVQAFTWGLDEGWSCSTTGARIITNITGNSCTGIIELQYNTRGAV
jgi:hypothetical protein